jgi:hypothetical protein
MSKLVTFTKFSPAWAVRGRPQNIIGERFFLSHIWVACGNRDIRDMVSACTVWFTFVFRTPIPRAVEDFIVKVLHASHGACHSASALLPSLCLYYITSIVICQGVFYIFFRGQDSNLQSFLTVGESFPISLPLPLTPLL